MNYWKDRMASFKYAFVGIVDVLKSQANLKIHLLATIVVLALGMFFEISKVEWCLIILCITAVLSAEIFNTAIEYLTDLVSPNYHILAKKTKDAAAGAVLIVAIGSTIIGFIIFLPKVLKLLHFSN